MKSLYNFLNGKGQLISLVVAIIGIVAVLGSIFSGLGANGYEVGTDLVGILKDEESTQTFDFFNMAINVPLVLLGIAAVALVFFGLRGLIMNPKGSIKVIIGIVVVIALLLIFKSMSDANVTGKAAELVAKDNLSDDTVKMIGGGTRAAVVLIAVAFGSAIVGGILNLFK